MRRATTVSRTRPIRITRRLRFRPQAEPGAAWELTLSEEPDQAGKAPLSLPMSEYVVGGRREQGVRGFLYFGQPPEGNTTNRRQKKAS